MAKAFAPSALRCNRLLAQLSQREPERLYPLFQAGRHAGVAGFPQSIQKRGLIPNGRGKIEILDRPGLELFACECHVPVNTEVDRLFRDQPDH